LEGIEPVREFSEMYIISIESTSNKLPGIVPVKRFFDKSKNRKLLKGSNESRTTPDRSVAFAKSITLKKNMLSEKLYKL
jgi:hypothetical protein